MRLLVVRARARVDARDLLDEMWFGRGLFGACTTP